MIREFEVQRGIFAEKMYRDGMDMLRGDDERMIKVFFLFFVCFFFLFFFLSPFDPYSSFGRSHHMERRIHSHTVTKRQFCVICLMIPSKAAQRSTMGYIVFVISSVHLFIYPSTRSHLKLLICRQCCYNLDTDQTTDYCC